jgi:hypothetical protein
MSKGNAGWIVSAVLALALVALLIVTWQRWYADQRTLEAVVDRNGENLAEARIEIEENCRGITPLQAQECRRALAELGEILAEFQQDLTKVPTTTEDGTPAEIN